MKKTFTIDVKDKKLLSLLEKDARISFNKIGKKIGVSKEVVNYRFKRLTSSGFIKRFFVIIDNIALDRRLYRLMIDLYNLKENSRNKIIEDLKKEKNVDLNIFLQSSRDLEIILLVKEPRDFYNFYDRFIKKYGSFVKRKNISVITKQYYLGYRHLHSESSISIVGDKKETIKIDHKDREILDLLIQNPRITVVDISEKLNSSPSSIISRINKLVAKKVIIGYGLVFDNSLLGLSTYRVEIILSDPSKKKEVVDYLIKENNVTKINEFVGEMDIDFEADFKTARDLDLFLEKIRTSLPQILDFEVISLIKY